jgi:metallo-beta-lactamase family protein
LLPAAGSPTGRHSRRHHPPLPLYTGEDADDALRHLRPQPFHSSFVPAPGLEATFSPVGHILGAACVRLTDGDTSVTFTGDVGRPVDPIMLAPEPPLGADYVVTESTYGNRTHGTADPAGELAEIATRTLGRGGALLVPVFAVGRAQTVLHLLSELRREGRIPEVPTYLNSPMAVNATELFCAHQTEHRLTADECKAMCDGVTMVRTAEESKRVSPLGGPMIVLAASGMATGGRVLHHLERLAPDHRNTILFVGFQAAGTRGEALQSGARRIKLYGSYVPVRAEVARIDSLSAHADADELTAWLGTSPTAPEAAYIVHGEPAAADAFRRNLRDDLGWNTHVPVHGETVDLRPATATSTRSAR